MMQQMEDSNTCLVVFQKLGDIVPVAHLLLLHCCLDALTLLGCPLIQDLQVSVDKGKIMTRRSFLSLILIYSVTFCKPLATISL